MIGMDDIWLCITGTSKQVVSMSDAHLMTLVHTHFGTLENSARFRRNQKLCPIHVIFMQVQKIGCRTLEFVSLSHI